MDYKLIGSILLVMGTSIGAGMLALPIATAELGFLASVALLIGCWFVMTTGALLLLEVNLWLGQNNNLITMAKATIGPWGQLLAWMMYLALLYSLICAYIAGGSDLLHHFLETKAFIIPQWSSAIFFTLLFGVIVYLGIRAVDYTNRVLMIIKFSGYFLLVLLLLPFIELPALMTTKWSMLASMTAITVTMTSFGFGAIVPSLRVYFAGDVKKLKKAIIIGSFIPLVCYIFWDAAIMGVIPLGCEKGLGAMLHSASSTSDLVATISDITVNEKVAFFAKLFTSVCVLTSFLGVSLAMTDFLADGLQLEKKGLSSMMVHLLTFLPPLSIVIFYPDAFIKALQYAGIYAIVLQIFLPAWMAWKGRKHHANATFKVSGGKPLLAFLLIVSFIIIIRSVVG